MCKSTKNAINITTFIDFFKKQQQKPFTLEVATVHNYSHSSFIKLIGSTVGTRLGHTMPKRWGGNAQGLGR